MLSKQTAILVPESNRGSDQPKVIVTKDKGVPEPADGEVLVNVHLRPVDPADIMSVKLVYPGFAPKDFPAVPGLEGVGKVHKNGQGAFKYKPGQRVVAVPWPTQDGNGTWQQYVNVPEQDLLKVPDAVSDESAAQFLVNPITAYGFLEYLQVPKGDYLLQGAGNSTLGRMVIKMASLRGVKTINLVRRQDAAKELKEHGADEVIVTTEEDVVARVREITGGCGAYAALDPVAGKMTKTMAAATRDSGQVLVYGALEGFEFTASVADVLFRYVAIRGFWLNRWLDSLGSKASAAVAEVMSFLAKGIIVPGPGKHYPLEKAQDAIEHMLKPAHGSKAFLEG